MSLTWEDLIEDETLSPVTRAIAEERLRAEKRREAERARLGEIGLHHRRVRAWQSDSLREFYKLFALQFEARAWEARDRKPLACEEATNTVLRKKRGMSKRLSKARREAAGGCRLQAEWLARHTELIQALEQP